MEWDERTVNLVYATPHDFGDEDPKALLSGEICRARMGRGAHLRLSAVPSDSADRMNRLLSELGYPTVDASREPIPWRPAGPSDSLRTATAELDVATFLRGRLEGGSDRLAEVGGVTRLMVSGVGGGSWTLDLTQATRQLVENDDRAAPVNTPTCSISLSKEDLGSIVDGSVSAGDALLEGRIRTAGDRHLVFRALWLLFAAGSRSD